MKKLFICFAVMIASASNAQVLIDDTTTPNDLPEPSAILELRSENKGFLLPRLNAAPASPVEGLIYYDTSGNCFKGYNGTEWVAVGSQCVEPTISTVTITQEDSSLAEGDSGTQTQTVTVLLDQPTTQDITVALAYSGSADASDFTAPAEITISNGQSSGTFDIVVNGDTDVEPDETVIVELNSITAGPGTIGTEKDYQLTITNDDSNSTGNDLPFVESFETGTSVTTDENGNPLFNLGGGDYFTVTDGSDIPVTFISGTEDGNQFFAAQDIDAGSNVSPNAILISDIDITGSSSLTFSVALAEDDDGNSEDYDGADYVSFQYRIDGGTYTEFLRVDGTGTNNEPTVNGVAVTDTWSDFSSNISVTGSTLDIRIEIKLNSGDEDIAIDNIRISAN